MLSLSGRTDEATGPLSAIEQLEGLDEGSLGDGSSSVEASLTLLRAGFPERDVGAQLMNARGLQARRAGNAMALRCLPLCRLGAVSQRGERKPVRGSKKRRRSHRRAGTRSPQRRPSRTSRSSRGSAEISNSSVRSPSRQWRSRKSAARSRSQRDCDGLRHPAGVPNARGGTAVGLQAWPRWVTRLGAAAEHRAWASSRVGSAAAHSVSASARRLQSPKRSRSSSRVRIRGCCPHGWRRSSVRPHLRRVPSRGGALSERELTVLRLLGGTLSERDIGRELYVSQNTVHSHVRSIFRKLGVSSRKAALDRARELHYL